MAIGVGNIGMKFEEIPGCIHESFKEYQTSIILFNILLEIFWGYLAGYGNE